MEETKMTIETIEDKKAKVSDNDPHKIVSRTEWLVACKDLLRREKAFGLPAAQGEAA
jgi:hypothetical protein